MLVMSERERGVVMMSVCADEMCVWAGPAQSSEPASREPSAAMARSCAFAVGGDDGDQGAVTVVVGEELGLGHGRGAGLVRCEAPEGGFTACVGSD